MKKDKVYVSSINGRTTYPKYHSHDKFAKIFFSNKKIKGGWVGINEPAAKAKNIKTNIKYGQVVVSKKNYRTIHHEEIEEHCMRYGHLPYKTAHKIALKFENTKVSPIDALRYYKNNDKIF